MKKKIKKSKYYTKKKEEMSVWKTILIFLGLMVAIISLTACTPQPIIREIKVPTPCQVTNKPVPPKDIDIDNSSIGVIMEYIKNIVKYAKEIQPVIKECVVEKK